MRSLRGRIALTLIAFGRATRIAVGLVEGGRSLITVTDDRDYARFRPCDVHAKRSGDGEAHRSVVSWTEKLCAPTRCKFSRTEQRVADVGDDDGEAFAQAFGEVCAWRPGVFLLVRFVHMLNARRAAISASGDCKFRWISLLNAFSGET